MKIFKPFLFLFLSFLFSLGAISQEVSINADGSKPHISSMLDVQSSTKGILIPRTDTSTINNAGNTIAVGLLIYQSSDNSFYFYNGTYWDQLDKASGLKTTLSDTDGDTKIYVEKVNDEDKIRFEIKGSKLVTIDQNGNLGIGSDLITNSSLSSRVLELTGPTPQIILNDNSGFAKDDFRIINGGAKVLLQNFTTGESIMSFGLAVDTNNVGIGTESPSERLHLNGNFRLQDGTEQYGFVLTSDSIGKTIWTSPDSLKDNFGNHTANQTIISNSNWISGDGNPEGLKVDSNGSLKIIANGGVNECGITQNSTLGGTSTMELTTADLSGNQTTRLLFRGNSNNSDIEFYRGGLNNELLSMKIEGTDGRVQIGTSNSFGLLNVGISPSLYDFLNSFTDYNNSNVSSKLASHTNAYRYSIWAENYVSGTGFHAHSDKRIKRIINVSNSTEDLKTLLNIRITNYQMIDTILHSNRIFKKVIAQNLLKNYPQAVHSNTTQFIPNIYKSFVFKNGLTVLNQSFEIGDRLKCFKNSKELIVTIDSISNEGDLLVYPRITGEFFIYGKQISDFHTVDYEAISMLNVSATQELNNKIEDLKAEIEYLKNENERIIQLISNSIDLKKPFVDKVFSVKESHSTK